MDECIDSLGTSKVFYTLHANSGYWQTQIRPSDHDNTALIFYAGSFRNKRTPLVLQITAATFQRALDLILFKYK